MFYIPYYFLRNKSSTGLPGESKPDSITLFIKKPNCYKKHYSNCCKMGLY